ncbi:hypothetical protein FO519_004708 [Halicephalobus sp. NKZ332]|nr:hypothetical protein FO519_004708 [Halicephalobus sp. NKZ332]
MKKNPPPPPPLPVFLKDISCSDLIESIEAGNSSRNFSSSVPKAFFEEIKSVKLKTVSSSYKLLKMSHINDDYSYLKKALDEKFRNANFDDFSLSRESTTWDE